MDCFSYILFTCPTLWCNPVFKVLRNGLLRYILHTRPNLWCNPCSKCYGMDCFSYILYTCPDLQVLQGRDDLLASSPGSHAITSCVASLDDFLSGNKDSDLEWHGFRDGLQWPHRWQSVSSARFHASGLRSLCRAQAGQPSFEEGGRSRCNLLAQYSSCWIFYLAIFSTVRCGRKRH